MQPRLTRFFIAMLGLCLALQANALDLRGPILGAASNFGQSWQPRALSGAEAIGLTEFRDEVIWNKVEQPDGRLVFGSMREAYPTMLQARGAGMVLLVYTGHPNWEDGRAPLTPEGQAAFARYAAQIVERFPLIHTVEIGNEYNADEFAMFERWPSDLSARAQAHVRLLAETVRAVRAVNPDIKFVGGAAHSIPLAWIEAVMTHGGGKHMDAFALHPYTTEPEQLRRQIDLMRQIPGLEDMPIEITEFGTTDAEIAPGYLLRMYCQMALSGVSRAVWYPFSPRGDGLIPLLEPNGQATGVGRAYRLIGKHMEGREAQDISPDAFTYGCRFGASTAVIWGAPRDLALATEATAALDAEGNSLTGPLRLSQTAPIVLTGLDGERGVLEQIQLGPQMVLADSFDQHVLDPERAPHDFDRFVLHRNAMLPFETRKGQDTNGVPWTPFLGIDQDGTVRMGSDWAMPSAWGANDPLEIVYRYAPTDPQSVRVRVLVEPDAASEDGVRLSLRLNDKTLQSVPVTGPEKLDFQGLTLQAEDRLDVVLGPNGNSNGDATSIRVTIYKEDHG